jgi:hypothetical protein
MQTIETKVLPATDTLPRRVKATHEGNIADVTIPADMYESIDAAYCDAAQKLMRKLEWRGVMIGGSTKAGMCFVFVSHDGPGVAMTDRQWINHAR